MAKAPKTISAADKKAALVNLKLALKQHSENVKSIGAETKAATAALNAAKKSADAITKEAEKAAAEKRKEAKVALDAAQKAYAAAVAKAEKAKVAAEKGAEKINAQIAEMEAKPLTPTPSKGKAKVAELAEA